MNMKKTNSTNRFHPLGLRMGLAFAAAAILAMPAIADAAPFGRGRGRGNCFGGEGRGGHGRMGLVMQGDLKRMQAALGLSQAQVNQMEGLRKSHKAGVEKTMLQLAQIDAQMKAEWLADKPNATKLRSMHKQKLALKANLASQRMELRLKISQILTPTQRMKLMRMGPRGGRFSRHGGRGPMNRRMGRFGSM